MIETLITSYLAFCIAGIVHEWAHGFVNYSLSDYTMEESKTFTFNPIYYMNFWGSIITPIITTLSSIGFFGWMRVTYKEDMITRPFRILLFQTLIGPYFSFIFLLFSVLLYKILVLPSYPHLGNVDFFTYAVFEPGVHQLDFFGSILFYLIWWNAAYVVLNLLPIPPFDGGLLLQYVFFKNELSFKPIYRWGWLIAFVLYLTGFLNLFIIELVNVITLGVGSILLIIVVLLFIYRFVFDKWVFRY
jgi:Zn-dependent protease